VICFRHVIVKTLCKCDDDDDDDNNNNNSLKCRSTLCRRVVIIRTTRFGTKIAVLPTYSMHQFGVLATLGSEMHISCNLSVNKNCLFEKLVVFTLIS